MNLRKRWRTFFGVFVLSILCFTSCENFLQGTDVKDEITKSIEYNNAPSYAINVEALPGSGTVKTPATGEVTKKVTDTFMIRFEPSDDHKFIKWEAVVKGLSSGESASDYIVFENPESLETKVTFKKASSNVIVIRPVCPARLSYTFYQGGGEVYPRDSSIEFNFNADLGEGKLTAFVDDYVTISNLPEGTSSAKYFKEPVVSGKKILFRSDTSNGYIPVANNAQRAVTVRIPKESIWYINEQYTQPVKVYLDSDIKETYLIGSETSAKTKFKYVLLQEDDNPIGSLKIDGEDNDGKEHGYSVNQTVSLRYKLPSGYEFKKWKFADSNGKELSVSDLSLFIDEENSNNVCQLSITIDNYMSDVITVTPICYENLTVDFNMEDSEKVYNRDSNIELTFNKPLLESSKAKVQIKFPGLEEGKSASDYFEDPVLDGKKLIIKAKNIGKDGLIPLLVDGTNTITITLPADDMLYEAQTTGGIKENIGLSADTTFTYKINGQTKNKTSFYFIDSGVNGVFKVDGAQKESTKTFEYSIGSKIQLSYSLSKTERKDFLFRRWKIERLYTDEAGANQIEEIDYYDDDRLNELHLRFTTESQDSGTDAAVYSAYLYIDDYITDVIRIQPYVTDIPDVKITINGGEHGLATVSGDVIYKLGESNHIEYKTDAAYAFIRWQLINSNTGIEIPRDEKANDGSYIYVQSSNLNSEKMDFIVKDLPKESDNVKFEFTPVVVERPQIISNTPINGTAVLKDTTVQVIFDYSMSEDSIYYTENEIGLLKTKLQLDDNYKRLNQADEVIAELLKDNTTGRYYGYKNDSEIVYKNISIVSCDSNNSNIIDCFDPPYFDTARKTLSLKVHRNAAKEVAIPNYTQILVAINENMFYEHEGKNVTLNGSKKWIYQVNDQTDKAAPTCVSGGDPVMKIIKSPSESVPMPDISTFTEIQASDIDSTGVLINGKRVPYYTGNNVSLDFNITDGDGSGIDSTFILKCTQLYNDKYTKLTSGPVYTVRVPSNSIGKTAKYTGTIQNVYNQLGSGIYSVEFIFSDVCGNELSWAPSSPWVLCIDKTSPNMDKTVLDITSDEEGTLKFDVDSTDFIDYKEFDYRYCEYGGTLSPDWAIQPAKDANGDVKLTGLKAGTQYKFVLHFIDYAGNKSGLKGFYTPYTIPAKPQNVTVAQGSDGISAIITCKKPSVGNCSKIEILYKTEEEADSESAWKIANAITSNSGSVTVSNLTKGKTYQFKIRSYDSESKLYSYPYTNNNELPSIKTVPNMPSSISTNFNAYTNKGIVSWGLPSSGNYSGFKVYCSTSSDFSSANTISATKDKNTTSHEFTSLVPGTYYYTKVEAYYGSETNVSSPKIKNTWTCPNSVSSLSCSTRTNNSISLSWVAPSTGYWAEYELWYKKSSDSSFTKTPVTRTATSYSIYDLVAGETYSIELYAKYQSSYSSKVSGSYGSWQLCPAPAGNVSTTKLSDTSFKTTWTAPSGNFDGYNLYISTTEAGLNSATAINFSKTETSYEKTGCTSRGQYYVRVETYIGTYNSSSRLKTNSDVVGCSLAFNAVTNLKADTYTTTGFRLYWTNPVIDYDGIEIWRDGSKITTLSKSTTSYTASSLSVNTSYTYKVVTYKGTGNSRLAAEAVISPTTKSSSVTSPKLTVNGPTSITVSWSNPSSTAYSSIYIYNVTTGITTNVTKGNTSYTFDNLAPGTQYTLRVRTRNSVSTASDYTDKTIRTSVAPVTSLSYSDTTQTSKTLTWTKPSGNYTGIKVSYKLSSASSYTTFNTYSSTTMTSATVTGLSAGNTYNFKVEAYLSADGTTYWSSVTTLTDYTAPPAVSNFQFTGRDGCHLKFSWSNPNSSNYEYVRIRYKLPGWTSYGTYTSNQTKGTTSVDLNLNYGRRYEVYAETYYHGFVTASSNTIKQVTQPSSPYNVAVNSALDVTTGKSSIIVSWEPPSGEQNYYRVKYRQYGTSTWYESGWITGTNTSSWKTESLHNSTQYEFVVYSNIDYSGSGYESLNSYISSSGTTYFTPPPNLPGVNVASSADSTGAYWYITIYNWDSVKDKINGINVFASVNGTTKLVGYSWYDNGSTHYFSKVYKSDVPNGSHLYLIPYHSKNSGHRESISPYSSWEDETYGNVFVCGSLQATNYR